ncbi:tetratricopeptide repeat protein, putative [Plasmodium vivax]|uniref:Tetratricopeptide repeat protein, putative n=1 Tax=Plasmodium vivax TaxID=5855 RepID=A0A565A3N8_PLAVI|nr:tetratricopeptide repeat protein, putative [Plasmodium vivax]
MITDSEAPTYNFNSDDEAPCEYLNDVYAISEDTFSFKIIKQLGEGYYSPGNGHKVKIIYYELGSEDKIASANVYLGKNDKLPYICEIAAKCMKPNEVCIIQAPKLFTKTFRNSERKNKYDRKENFRTEFKKALRFKQKCIEKYFSYSTVATLKRIKLSSNDVKLLVRKRKLKKATPDGKPNVAQKNASSEELKGDDPHKCSESLTLEDINNVKYKFLKEEELSTYVVYLKEYNRVDILNDDRTIIKEVMREGKGIVTPKKNDYIDFFLQDGKKSEFIHTILEVHNLKYRGLFQILQNMKKKEMSRIVLKGLECLHIYHSVQNTHIEKEEPYGQEKKPNDVQQGRRDFCQDDKQEGILNETSLPSFESNQVKQNDGEMKEGQEEAHLHTSNELPKQKKEIIIELVDFKKSKRVNISSIINQNYTEKLLFYLSEDGKNQNTNKPIIDADCELIIHVSINNDKDRTKGERMHLPVHFWKNNGSIKKRKAFFLFSYGSCFTAPLWFYECFKGLKEGDEVIVPLSKNRNVFSENQFAYHLIFEETAPGEEAHQGQGGTDEVEVEGIKRNSDLKNDRKEPTPNDSRQITKRNHSGRKSSKMKDRKFVQRLISNRNKGKGFFLIDGLKKNQVDRFCEGFFSSQTALIDGTHDEAESPKSPFHCSSFQKVMRKKFYKSVANIQKRRKLTRMKHQLRKQLYGGNSYKECISKKLQHRGKKTDNFSFFKRALKNVYFEKSFYQKDAILKIKIVKLICKKKDPWNMNMSEQIEYLKIYNKMGNTFMKKNLYYAASLHYIKGFDIFRFSKMYTLIFEEKKTNVSNLATDDDMAKELVLHMEKILTNLAISHYKLGNYNECVKYAESAATINPENVKCIYWKHMAYLQQNKYHQVIKNLNNSFCLNNLTLLKLYNTARVIKKKQDAHFNSLFYAMYDQK